MKEQVIKDFQNYIKKMNKGYRVDYEYILHKIAFIQTYSSLSNIDAVYGFLINK